MHGGQIGLDLPHWHAHDGAQIGNQTADAHYHPPVSDHLGAQLHGGFAPVLTLAAPAMIHYMLGDLHRRRWRHLNHLPTPRNAHSSQPTAARGTHTDPVFDDVRRGFPTAGVIMLGIALLARLPLLCWRLRHIGLDKGWRRLLLLLQVLDALLSERQLLGQSLFVGLQLAHLFHQPLLAFLGLAQSREYFMQLLLQLCQVFFLRHALSLSKKGHSEQYRIRSTLPDYQR